MRALHSSINLLYLKVSIIEHTLPSKKLTTPLDVSGIKNCGLTLSLAIQASSKKTTLFVSSATSNNLLTEPSQASFLGLCVEKENKEE